MRAAAWDRSGLGRALESLPDPVRTDDPPPSSRPCPEGPGTFVLTRPTGSRTVAVQVGLRSRVRGTRSDFRSVDGGWSFLPDLLCGGGYVTGGVVGPGRTGWDEGSGTSRWTVEVSQWR